MLAIIKMHLEIYLALTIFISRIIPTGAFESYDKRKMNTKTKTLALLSFSTAGGLLPFRMDDTAKSSGEPTLRLLP